MAPPPQSALPARAEDDRETSRAEAFSDGVFAIAITILVLDLEVPSAASLARAHQTLMQGLVAQWPTYAAYLISFLTVLIMWLNHHRMFQHIRRTDQAFLLLNGLLLMWIALVFYPTKLLAEHLAGPDARTAAGIYSALFTLIAVNSNLLWRYATAQGRLLGETPDAAAVEAFTRHYRFEPALYLAAFLVALASAAASVGACLAVAVLYALPPRPQRLV